MKINRKAVKQLGRKALKMNYLCAVAVCFILSFFGAEYVSSTSVIKQNDAEHIRGNEIVYESSVFENWQSFKDAVDKITMKWVQTDETAGQESITQIVSGEIKNITTDSEGRFSPEKLLGGAFKSVFNSLTENTSYIFKFLSGGLNILGSDEPIQGLLLWSSGMFQLALSFFVLKILVIGGKKFFIESSRNKMSKNGVSLIFSAFTSRHYLNCVFISFLKSLFWSLWSLTIIGGVIKMYEYRMIPYILADNPALSGKEVFALSKKMTKRHKWQLFKFDLSYIGWNILSGMTFGALGIFYVNPYRAAAEAEIYETLKAEAAHREVAI